jgi:hypothetical protein
MENYSGSLQTISFDNSDHIGNAVLNYKADVVIVEPDGNRIVEQLLFYVSQF